MSDEFVGKWISDSAENMEAYMEALGANWVIRKLVPKIALTLEMTIEINGNHWNMNAYSAVKNFHLEFDLGKEFEEVSGDGRKVLSTLTFENGKLFHIQKALKKEEKNSSYVSYIENGKLIQIAECDGVESRRIYTKVE
uniref:Lipocalin/cytosolic fatty-acid binding domain-containing protein n=1 Tax=Panagrolaimus davidi TaxID=227884 RepID=A0A914Q7F7_9BILA